MATTSFQPTSLGHHGKFSKTRTRGSVRPILKKFHSSSLSEKNSLDLDRGWEDQPSPQLGYTEPAYIDEEPSVHQIYPSANCRSTRDVSFALSATDLSTLNSIQPSSTFSSTSTSGLPSSSNVNNPSHTRSTSNASHISLATSASGRNGSFVHPFQQTPRTSTPPLISYANSLASLDQRDTSPTTITEDDDLPDSVFQGYTPPQSQVKSPFVQKPSAPIPITQRAGSLSDAQPTLRIATGWTASGTGPRSVNAASSLHQHRSSDGQLSGRPSLTVIERSPLSSTPVAQSPQAMATPISTHAMSPLRTSLDMNNFRLRSRSDVDTATRQEQVRAARQKFDEKERAKEEKYAREQSRKRERADTKEAQRIERAQAGHHRKGSNSGRTSCSTDIRPVFSRRNTGNSRLDTASEKTTDFVSRGYREMAPAQSPQPQAENVQFESPRRSTKRKTTGTWTAFVLWFRTRLLKLGRR
ncbi:unnamed protein product [Clonostachys byssicola]|uniref:Uncharacterized protein n=1 Tax=Clonostachys byssicola TaxID=160290 RepID=A0A9N9UKB6_9HYPO|nr:unnamed protein product [Clonostachys byssicola]